MYKFVWNQYRPPLGLRGRGDGGLRLAKERVKPGLIWKWLALAPFTHQGINTPVRSGWHPPLTIRDTPRCSTPSQGYRPAERDKSLPDQVLFNKGPSRQGRELPINGSLVNQGSGQTFSKNPATWFLRIQLQISWLLCCSSETRLSHQPHLTFLIGLRQGEGKQS